MRVITLLPAATEIVAALGGAGYLVGISHECDYPPSVQHLPRVTATPVDIRAPGAEIDAEVRRFVNTGYESAKQIIENNRPLLSTIALSLLEREVLDAGELKLILEGKPLPARVLPPKEDGVQQVLKPEPGRTPGIVPGKTSPA